MCVSDFERFIYCNDTEELEQIHEVLQNYGYTKDHTIFGSNYAIYTYYNNKGDVKIITFEFPN